MKFSKGVRRVQGFPPYQMALFTRTIDWLEPGHRKPHDSAGYWSFIEEEIYCRYWQLAKESSLIETMAEINTIAM